MSLRSKSEYDTAAFKIFHNEQSPDLIKYACIFGLGPFNHLTSMINNTNYFLQIDLCLKKLIT